MENDVSRRPTAAEVLRAEIFSGVGDTFVFEAFSDGTRRYVAVVQQPAAVVPAAAVALAEPAGESGNNAEDAPERQAEDIDDTLAVVRGKEDDGDAEGKGRDEVE
jgi:hypothetical protein